MVTIMWIWHDLHEFEQLRGVLDENYTKSLWRNVCGSAEAVI